MAVAGQIMAGSSGGFRRKPSLLAWLVFAPLAIWLLLFVILPTGMLVALSFAEQRGLGTIHFTWTLDNYARAFQWTWLKVLLVSVWYAFLTTIICMVLGYPVAYYIGRSGPRTREILLALVMIPFWTSFLIRTYAWITILSKEGLLNTVLMSMNIVSEPLTLMYTPFASVLGLVYNFLPFMILPIYSSVERLDGAMIEAAHDLGAGPVRAFSQVIIPLTSPGIAAGALLVFIPSIAMFAITNLMGGGRQPTIGQVIYNQFTAGRNQPFGAALGTLLLIIFILALYLTKRYRKE